MQDEQIKYVMDSTIGPLLCKGFAYLYRQKPQFPVRKLAQWLLAQGKKNIEQQKQTKNNDGKAEKIQQLSKIKEERQQKLQESKKVETWQQQKQRFLADIANSEHPEDLLTTWLPQYLQEEKGLSACYVGLLGPQRKIATDDNDDENAHLDLEGPKVITYIGANSTNKQLMIGRILPPEKGITLDVFKPDQPVDPPAEEQEKKEPPKFIKQKYVYVPNVLKEDKIYYFRLPKLGSFAAFAMNVQNFMSEQTLDKGCEEQKKFLTEKQEAEKARESKLAEMKNELDEYDRKDEEGIKNTEEYITLKKQYDQLNETPAHVPPPVFLSTNQQYVVGCDTLGQDQGIPEQTLQQIQQFIALFVRCWEDRQKQHLLHDINLQANAPTSQDNIEAGDKINEQIEADVSARVPSVREKTTDEKEVAYELDILRLRGLQRAMTQKGLRSLSLLQNFYIPKFKNAIQAVYLFAEFTKSHINLKGTNILDWRVVNKCLSSQLVQKVLNYNHQGLKSQAPPSYARVSRLIQRFGKIDMQGLQAYNLGLWILVRIAKLSLSLRVAKRDLLFQRYENNVKQREAKTEEQAKIADQRAKALEAHKASLEPEQLESFNEVEWLENFDRDRPMPVLPDQIHFTQYSDI